MNIAIGEMSMRKVDFYFGQIFKCVKDLIHVISDVLNGKAYIKILYMVSFLNENIHIFTYSPKKVKVLYGLG